MATAYGLELEPGMHEEFDFSNWSERQSVQLGPFIVTPYAVNHPVEEAYALRVEVTEPDKEGKAVSRVLTYSGTQTRARALRTRPATPISSSARPPSKKGATTTSRMCT
ncbi:hypothetical protein AHiyo8_57010 [Arthrobacter sp. Hiyo8]|nr:hypothetical protein AHiyo8_57010 [Arthrobacter sp. Hiyo8]